MLDIKQILSFYPENFHPYQRNLVREYLQFKILETIYDTALGQKLIFMGGTAIHLIHGNTRFSEDLDFDNRGLEKSDFDSLIAAVKMSLTRMGYKLEYRNVYRSTFRSYLKFSEILFELKISGHKQEKLNIQIDTEPQKFEYDPDRFIINKFDVFQKISVVPSDILLAQKIYCIFSRPRSMGRDFFDSVFLLGKTKPNMDYLQKKMGIKNSKELKSRLMTKSKDINFAKLAKDIEPFLYDPRETKRVLHFFEFIQSVDF
jgi:predicted nucleotidyltransferase component of viral defense system